MAAVARQVSSLAPQTARQARLLRVANKLAREKTPGAPTDEAAKLLWAQSHARHVADRRLSTDEEKARIKMFPKSVTANNMSTGEGLTQAGNLFHFRDFPMYPGEYVPPEQKALSSLRDDLASDLTAQSLKEAWMRVSGGSFFDTPGDFYARADGLDETQLGEIVAALFPGLSGHQSRALIRRVLESVSKPDSTPARQLASQVTAETLGLDKAPGHYTNFLEWMGRIMDTKAFKTEHSIFQFCRRKFSKSDVRVMWENYNLLSSEALQKDRTDGYSHFHAVLKDFSIKVAGQDTRHQLGVRIDPQEIDENGFSYGYGRVMTFEATCILKQNEHKRGRVFVHGKPLHEQADNKAWVMELYLSPFDEAGLDWRDFDAYFVCEGTTNPNIGQSLKFAAACRFALATAISKMLPVKRIPLKKAGYLSVDRRQRLGDHPGFLNNRRKRRPFYKRA